MWNSWWDRIFRRSRWEAEEAPRDDVEEALRASRPVPPALSEGRANSMLAHALAEARMPCHRGRRNVTLVAVFAVAGCVLAVGLLVARQTSDRWPAAASSFSNSRRWKRSIVEAIPVQLKPVITRRTLRSAPITHYRRLQSVHIRRRRVSGHRLWAIRHVRSHPAILSVRDERRMVVSSEARRDTCPGVVPSASESHLVLIVTGAADPGPIVEIGTDSRTSAGFARASAFHAVGAGGGVLTQCTLHTDMEQNDTNTIQFGIVYGQPILRLPVAVDQPNIELPENEREIKL